ncbi:hypothetical protein FJY94_05775 [Candidatus Kaiserbacteria bacterium]|nr:hypothetical protein [Candidatus Kaiserbacteria bacterium]
MGGGSWDSRAYDDAASQRAASNTPAFDYSQKVKSGSARGIHASLDPRTVAGAASPLAGQVVRESRDSADHPESLPVIALFDVTGSMGRIPQVLQTKLTSLMDVIVAKAGIKDVQILVGAIGDTHSDDYPFQVGQFESDNRFDEQLRSIILEGNGGGQKKESYALAYRFAADHTATDAWDKRGKKGYLFSMGDEGPWPTVTVEEVERIFGVKAEADESVESLIARAQERWEIFHLFSMDGGYPNDRAIAERWQELLGERFVKVEDSSLICEVIAGLIHMLESSLDADRVVHDMGLKGASGTAVKNALVPVGNTRLPKTVAHGSVPTQRTPKGGGIERI